MFKRLRKNVKLIIWIIVVAFTLWGAGSIAVSRKKSLSYAGAVFGKNVTYKEFDDLYKMIQLFSGQTRGEELSEPYLSNATWQHLALLAEAKQRKIKASDEEVRGEIQRQFSKEGKFDLKFYNFWARNVAQESPRDFEEKLRKVLMIRKLLDSVAREVEISQEELKENYFSLKKEMILEYVSFPFDEYQNKMEIPETVKPEEKEAFIAQELEKLAQKEAQEFYQGLAKDGTNFVERASQTAKELKKTPSFSKESLLRGEAQAELANAGQFFLMSAEKITEAMKTEEGYRIYHLAQLKEPRSEDFEKAKDEFQAKLLDERKRTKVNLFLLELMSRAQVKRYSPEGEAKNR